MHTFDFFGSDPIRISQTNIIGLLVYVSFSTFKFIIDLYYLCIWTYLQMPAYTYIVINFRF